MNANYCQCSIDSYGLKHLCAQHHAAQYKQEKQPWTVDNLEREMDYPASVERIVNTLNLYDEVLSLLKEARNRMIGSSPAIVSLAKRTDEAIARANGL